MTPLTHAHLELLLAVHKAEARALAWRAAQPQDLEPAALDKNLLHDHQLDVAGDLSEALDHVEPGLGRRFMQALNPDVDLDLEADTLAAMYALFFGSLAGEQAGQQAGNPA